MGIITLNQTSCHQGQYFVSTRMLPAHRNFWGRCKKPCSVWRLCPSGITFLGVTNPVPGAVAGGCWAEAPMGACVCPSPVPFLIPLVFAWWAEEDESSQSVLRAPLIISYVFNTALKSPICGNQSHLWSNQSVTVLSLSTMALNFLNHSCCSYNCPWTVLYLSIQYL